MMQTPPHLCSKPHKNGLSEEGTERPHEAYPGMASRTNRGVLPADVRLALGAELRWAFSSWAIQVPLPLLRLANKTLIPPNARPEIYPLDEPTVWCEKGVIDPAGAIVFDKAFTAARAELEDMNFPVQREALARCISELIVEECDPGRLKTKAIIKLSRLDQLENL